MLGQNKLLPSQQEGTVYFPNHHFSFQDLMLRSKSWRGEGQVFNNFGWISTKSITKAGGYSRLKDQGSAPDPCLTLSSWEEGADLLS